MVDPGGFYAANREDVAAKVIDGELIVIRLSDGTYYSMGNVGAYVWELLESGLDVAAVARTVADRYATPVGRVDGDVDELVRELLSEGLIVASPPVRGAAVEPPPPGPLEYETPRLDIYRDMGNLLALDPPTPGIDDLLLRDEKTG